MSFTFSFRRCRSSCDFDADGHAVFKEEIGTTMRLLGVSKVSELGLKHVSLVITFIVRLQGET